eukprot:TRINITY_DN7332_c0_g1_i3.p1 TRINITY_DN7332_c0_g1~~TRINITY_DN7332_c0_g1_i3.p1  ORF type:complete len:316 (-),score=68.15 TRINITY_DN7332_c0_g1_i3:6-953(-)
MADPHQYEKKKPKTKTTPDSHHADTFPPATPHTLPFHPHLSTRIPSPLTLVSTGNDKTIRLHKLKEDKPGELGSRKTWRLLDLKKMGALGKNEMEFYLHFEKQYKWAAFDVVQKNSLLWCLIRLAQHQIKLTDINVTDLTLVAEANNFEDRYHLNTTTLDIMGAGSSSGSSSSSMRSPTLASIASGGNMLSPEEAQEIDTILNPKGVGGTTVSPLQDVDAFTEQLTDELLAVEAANIYAIISSEQAAITVMDLIDDAIKGLDEVQDWMRSYESKFNQLKTNISQIEMRNNKTEIVAKYVSKMMLLLKHILKPSRH